MHFLEVESDGELMLDEDFVMNIFSPLYDENLMYYYFEEKESNVTGSFSQRYHVLAIDLAKCEVNYPKHKYRINRQMIYVLISLQRW